MPEPRFQRPPAPAFQQALLKSTPLVYRGPVASILESRCVMLLTTTGRKTGRPRTTAISFMPLGERLVVFSGWGTSSNWYRNVRANPAVSVRVGNRHFQGTAKLVADPERRRQLMFEMQKRAVHCGPPTFTRGILKALRLFDYEGEINLALAQGRELPVLEISPRTADTGR